MMKLESFDLTWKESMRLEVEKFNGNAWTNFIRLKRNLYYARRDHVQSGRS